MKYFFFVATRLPGFAIAAGMLLAPLGTAQAQLLISSTIPMNNAKAAPAAGPVTVNFNQALTAGSTGALQVFSAQRGGLRTGHSGTTSVNGSTLSFAPTYPFKPGETVQATVKTSATASSSAGGMLATAKVWQFTAAAGVGPGTFGGGSDTSVGSFPRNVVVGDVDGDGDLDLLTANGGSPGTVSVRLNNGSGIFSGGSDPSVGSHPYAVAVGDVDGDGDLDLLTANDGNNPNYTVSVRLNNGNGVFSGGSDPSVGSQPYSVAVGDVDGDGDLDLLTANWGNATASVRLNNGSGVFSGGSDLSVGYEPYSIAVGDVDGDGDLDLLTANSTGGTVSVRLNNGSGVFSGGSDPSVSTSPLSVVVGDVDGDGDLDLLTANINSNTVSVRLNNGSGVFSGGSDPVVGGSPSSVVVGDVDGDGDLDLLTTIDNQSGTVSVRLNNGSGMFSGGSDFNVGSFPVSVMVGDVDGDGDLDMLAANYDDNTVSVRFNGGALPTRPASGPAAFSVSPNPGRDAVLVTGLGAGASVAVVDVLGQVVATATVDAAGQAPLLLPAGLRSGLYLVRSGSQVQRLVVE